MAGTDTEEVVVHMFSTVLGAAGRQVKVVMWLAAVRGRCRRCRHAIAGSLLCSGAADNSDPAVAAATHAALSSSGAFHLP